MEFLNNLGSKKIAAIAGIAALVLIGILLLAFNASSPIMSTLYSGLSVNDSSMIVAKLQSLGIKYETDATGNEIRVPADKVLTLRMNFAQEGIPDSGSIVGYEIFDKSEALGTSQFVYNVNLVRALEGELSRTIGALNNIERARVHLVIPKKELFSKINSEPSASVVLTLKSHNKLSKAETSSITHLIATAVNGLKTENITIIDNKGRPLKLGTREQNDQAAITSDSADFQSDVEKRLQREIEELLERYVGIGKVKANVAAEIAFDREVINEEIYDPDGQVVRSKKTEEESSNEKQGSQNVGVVGNIPNVNEDAEGATNTSNKSRVNEVVNYEITKRITNKIIESGQIKKLSIAILIDGTYNIDEETGEASYIERDAGELDKIKKLVISAVGIDDKRGDIIEVINLRFSKDFNILPEKEDPLDWVKNDLQGIVQTIVIGLVIILVLLLVVRPTIMRVIEAARQKDDQEDLQSIMDNVDKEVQELQMRAEQEAGLVDENGNERELVNLTSTEEKKKVDMIGVLNDMVEQHPDETIAIIRNWLYQD